MQSNDTTASPPQHVGSTAELNEWKRGWQALCDEATRRGTLVGGSTTHREVPSDLWARMISYPPKPSFNTELKDGQ